MKIVIPAGKYIVAVSGGVDSMVLLDMLSRKTALELIVAHFNHGMRQDACLDERFVKDAAKKYGLKFESDQASLGANASEDQARRARYEFLWRIKDKNKAMAIITAHHQDDLIETAILNILRGTGPQGMVSMIDNKYIIRPLLKFSKAQILEYADRHKLKWREDPTNQDVRYLRNYVRLKLVPRLNRPAKQKLLESIDNISSARKQTLPLIQGLSGEIMRNGLISRQKFINLPLEVGKELLAYWLGQYGAADYDKQTISRLSTALKTAQPGTEHDVRRGLRLKVDINTAEFIK